MPQSPQSEATRFTHLPTLISDCNLVIRLDVDTDNSAGHLLFVGSTLSVWCQSLNFFFAYNMSYFEILVQGCPHLFGLQAILKMAKSDSDQTVNRDRTPVLVYIPLFVTFHNFVLGLLV